MAPTTEVKAKSGMAAGLNAGHIVTVRAQALRPSQKKGVRLRIILWGGCGMAGVGCRPASIRVCGIGR